MQRPPTRCSGAQHDRNPHSSQVSNNLITLSSEELPSRMVYPDRRTTRARQKIERDRHSTRSYSARILAGSLLQRRTTSANSDQGRDRGRSLCASQAGCHRFDYGRGFCSTSRSCDRCEIQSYATSPVNFRRSDHSRSAGTPRRRLFQVSCSVTSFTVLGTGGTQMSPFVVVCVQPYLPTPKFCKSNSTFFVNRSR
jgi:hypothetical protein